MRHVFPPVHSVSRQETSIGDGRDEVDAFLTSLAVDGKVSASTQSQALSALLFLYKAVLEDPLPWLNDLVRAQSPQRLPVVLTIDEVRRVIDAVEEPSRLVVKLLYGSGLRLMEALTLRVVSATRTSTSLADR